jgi:hypothetical protein
VSPKHPNLSCPVKCLGLSKHSYNALMRAYRATFDAPQNVDDLVELVHKGQLDEIWGLGPIRIKEIEAALVFAGFNLDFH